MLLNNDEVVFIYSILISARQAFEKGLALCVFDKSCSAELEASISECDELLSKFMEEINSNLMGVHYEE